MLTQEELKETYLYAANTGIFTRAKDKGYRKKGTIVGTLDKSTGYVRIWLRVQGEGKLFLAHRLAWLYVYGYFPKDIDHKDRCKTNNAIANLREVTSSENNQNRSRRVDNASGITGVNFRKASGKFIAQIRVNERLIYLGSFKTLDEAAVVRKQAEKDYGFSPIHGL